MGSKLDWVLFNLESAVDHERLEAIILASEHPHPRVIQTLSHIATNDPSLDHRHRARLSLLKLKERISRGITTTDETSIAIGKDQIREALASRDARMRVKGLQALMIFDMPDRGELLRTMVRREKDPFVRAELARSLVVLGEEAIPQLVELLAEPDVRIRVNVIEALEGLGLAQGYELVVTLLLDAQPPVRRAAAVALNRFGKSNLLDVLTAMIKDQRTPHRDAAVHALALIRKPETLPLMELALADPVEGIRQRALEGLELLAQGGLTAADLILERYRAQTKDKTDPHGVSGEVVASIQRGELLEPINTANLLQDFDPENRIAEIKKIVRMKAYERAAELAARLKIEQDKNVLSCIVLALGRLKAREYAPALKRYLRSANDRVRANAVEAIGLMEDRSLLGDLTRFLEDPSSRVRVNAILALRGQTGHSPHEALAACLSSDDAGMRLSALYGLLELHDDAAVALMGRALDDADTRVRDTTVEYLAILRSEGIEAARSLYDEAHARGLRPPDTEEVLSRTTRRGRLPRFSLQELLYYLKESNGSDLHLNAGVEPCVRMHGTIRRVRCLPLTADDTKRMIYGVLSEDQVVQLEKNCSLDFSYSIAGVARFRVNAFKEVRGYKAVFRLVPMDVPTIDELGLPPIFRRFCQLKQGLVLVTGPTGSGKSTTLAAMLNEINCTEQKHIITIEDPIEFMHQHRLSIISQRELGMHAHSFGRALRDALREDPNVILVGEMRDLETMSLAVTAAETGHLVLSTLHTYSAGQSINRIVDVFPANQQDQARQQLSNSLQAIIGQRLVPDAAGERRYQALEIMVNTPAMSNLIREGKIEQIYTLIQVSHEVGMTTLDADLARLVNKGDVTKDVAAEFAIDRKSFLASIKVR